MGGQRRRSPRRHTVHTFHPRYRVPQYGRGSGYFQVNSETNLNPSSYIEPKTVRQAVLMISRKEIPVQGSYALQTSFNELNNQYFKGKLPDYTILLADLPLVKHQGFHVAGAKIIVINTARAETLQDQENILKHEIIHCTGINSHGFLFQHWAKILNAPIADFEGKPISLEEYEKIKEEREKQRWELQRQRLAEKGLVQGRGTLKRNDLPVARILGWSGIYQGKERFSFNEKNIYRIEDLPKYAKDITLVLFDETGTPKPKESPTVIREDLKNYYIVS